MVEYVRHFFSLGVLSVVLVLSTSVEMMWEVMI